MITRGSKFFYGSRSRRLPDRAVLRLRHRRVRPTAACSRCSPTAASSTRSSVPSPSAGRAGSATTSATRCSWAFAAVMAVLGGFTSAFRDGDAEAVAQVRGRRCRRLPARPRSRPGPELLAAGHAPSPRAVAIVGLALSTVAVRDRLRRSGRRRASSGPSGHGPSGPPATPAPTGASATQLMHPLEIPVWRGAGHRRRGPVHLTGAARRAQVGAVLRHHRPGRRGVRPGHPAGQPAAT